MRALVLAASLAGLTACFTPVSDEGTCRTDSDCGGQVCTRIGECASQSYALLVKWTILGEPANATGACDDISDLAFTVGDPTTGAQRMVAPVPCASGSFFYDKLPLGYTDVEIVAYARNDTSWLTSVRGTSIGADGVVTLDLEY